MPGRFVCVSFVGKSKKEVDPGRNRIRVHGDNLDDAGGVTVDGDLDTSLPGYTWTVISTRATPNYVEIVGELTPPRRRRDETGDLTITLDYSDEPDDLEVVCEDVEYNARRRSRTILKKSRPKKAARPRASGKST